MSHVPRSRAGHRGLATRRRHHAVDVAVEAFSVPTGVDLDYFRRPQNPQPTADLVFVGSMDWMPNSDGVNYFVREILPLIWKRKPDCTLAIVGRSPSRATQAWAKQDSRIQVTG